MTLKMLAVTCLMVTTTAAASNQSAEQTRDGDVAQLGKRFLIDVTYEKRSFDGSVIVNLRTTGPSHDRDSRIVFPREEMRMVIQGTKGAVVFESALPWRPTGERTSEGKPTYIARILVHPELKHGFILTEALNGLEDEATVGIVTFQSLFKK